MHSAIKTFCLKKKPIWIIFFGTLILVCIEAFFYYLFIILKVTHKSNLPLILPVSNIDTIFYIVFRVVKACFLAPIVETFIFQYLLFRILCVKFKIDTKYFVIISAVIFGLSHFIYFTTVVVTFVMCIVVNYLYIMLIETKNGKKAFFIIALIHSCFNACVLIDQYFNK
jgi:hypothetical protein